ncbi:DUF6220 domain-containing protein [Brevibacillus panacihumi]|uniref:Uncharacterized protein n=1 Tax=Brevibacillus panacihumi TaxID=497735 RepID=A0A3M8C5H9_9BACL|nr:DUF6220 domain-containing protein [Brevibacillus panacihumi]RNB70928.1 hypothetical protein EDM58_22905 [Brevibacillus panacihumi]
MNAKPVMIPKLAVPAAIRYARIGFALLAGVLAIVVAAQVFLAGLAVFYDPTRWVTHSSLGSMAGVIPIFLLILSFLGRLPRKTKIKCALLILLIIVNFSTVIFAKELGYWAAIHPVAALGLFLNSFLVLRDSLMKQLPSDSVGE